MSVPPPPGNPQTTVTAQQMLAYLGQLGPWIDDSRRQLDRLDQKIQTNSPGAGVQDMAMTLTVWQAINTRYLDLTKVWDSGRVGEVELKKLTGLIWGNLNDMLTPGATINSGGGLALSLPEACRMLEALISQLTSRYQLAPVPTQVSARITQLRAQVERIRDQAKLDPPQIRATTEAPVTDLLNDVAELIAKADRGGDIGGTLGPLEVRAARLERDLIVGHSERAMLADKVSRARAHREGLIAREQAVTDLVRSTRAALTPAPKYAVPSVAALGEVPATAQELDAYQARLSQVSQALDMVQQANLTARARKDSLTARLAAAEAKAPAGSSLAQSLVPQIHGLLAATPAQLDVIEPMIVALEASGRQS